MILDKVVMVRLDKTGHAKLKKYAKALNMSLSAYVRFLVESRRKP